ncbi:MAG: hypothetical protein WAO00_03935 [Chthoniobacterales bacterium]
MLALVLFALSGCDSHTAKFKAGDHVIRKLTGRQAVVWWRARPFAEDVYFLKVRDEAGEITDTAYYAKITGKPRNWHLDGPYHEDDLLLASR